MAHTKTRKHWKKVEYAGKKRTIPSAERIHLEKVHAGKKSHK